MKKMLCLLSAQLIPNILAVHHFCPDSLVILQTDSMAAKSDDFLLSLKYGGLDYHNRIEKIFLKEEDSLSAIRDCLAGAVSDSSWDDEWIVNITGGTKPMSLGTYDFFKYSFGGRQSQFVYTSASKPNTFINSESDSKTDGCHKFTLTEFFAAYGFKITENETESAKTEVKDRLWECARIIAENLKPGRILEGDQQEFNQRRHQGASLAKKFLKPFLREKVFPFFSGRALSDREWGFLNGEWLEVFIAGLIGMHVGPFSVGDVRIGLKVNSVRSPQEHGGTEFDVAFIRNNALYTVECKCGNLRNKEPNEYLDKLFARTKNLNALRANSILATNALSVYDSNLQPKSQFVDRAGLYDIKLLLADDMRRLGKEANNHRSVYNLIFK